MPITKVAPQGNLSAATGRSLWLLAGKQEKTGVLVFIAPLTSGGGQCPRASGERPSGAARTQEVTHWQAASPGRATGPKSRLLSQWVGSSSRHVLQLAIALGQFDCTVKNYFCHATGLTGRELALLYIAPGKVDQPASSEKPLMFGGFLSALRQSIGWLLGCVVWVAFEMNLDEVATHGFFS